LIDKVCDALNIDQIIVTTDIHTNAGSIENVNGRALRLMRKLIAESGSDFNVDTIEELVPIEMYLMNTTATSSGVIPSKAFLAVNPTNPLKAATIRGTDINANVITINEHTIKACNEEIADMREALDDTHRRLVGEKMQARQKSRDAALRAARKKKNNLYHVPHIETGDAVLVSFPNKQDHKLDPLWKGPFIVIGPKQSSAPIRTCKFNGIDESTHVFTLRPFNQPDATFDAHITRIRTFLPSAVDVPLSVQEQAQQENGQFVIDEIVGYNVEEDELYLMIKWLGFDTSANSLKHITEMIDEVPKLTYEYCRANKDAHIKIQEYFDHFEVDRNATLQRRRALYSALGKKKNKKKLTWDDIGTQDLSNPVTRSKKKKKGKRNRSRTR